MGAHYSLSVIGVSPRRMRALNKTYRKKNASTDILAFSLSKNAGEIYLSLPDVKKKAKLFGMTPKTYLEYLYVHGLVHLKGFDHGKKMDALEKKYCTQLDISLPSSKH